MLSAGVSASPPAPPTVAELKRVVEQKEQELSAAQIALTVARARLARAEGKAELAAKESRTLLRYYEGELKLVQDQLAQGRLCFVEPLRQAEGSVAVARAWLAEAENRRDDLIAELPRVIAYHEWRIRFYQRSVKQMVITEQEAGEVLKESETDLRWARERLAQLRGGPSRQEKTGKNDKP